MGWYTVLESVKGESSRLGRANARIFFLFLFPYDVFFLFFFHQEPNKCFPFIIIYYFAQYSCIACIMLLKPIVDSLFHYVSHLPNHSMTFFSSSSQVVRWSAEIQTKVYYPRKEGSKEWPIDRPSEWILARSLNSYFAFCKIVVKTIKQKRLVLLNRGH